MRLFRLFRHAVGGEESKSLAGSLSTGEVADAETNMSGYREKKFQLLRLVLLWTSVVPYV